MHDLIEIIKEWWWAFTIVAALFSFFVNYSRVVEWVQKKTEIKQPKLSIRIDKRSKDYQEKPHNMFGKSSAYDRMYEGLLTFDSEKPVTLEREYIFTWTIDLTITNISSFSAYRISLKPIMFDDDVQYGIDSAFTATPFVPESCQTNTIVLTKRRKCDKIEAEGISIGGILKCIVLEYYNVNDVKFMTEYKVPEQDSSKKNSYKQIG